MNSESCPAPQFCQGKAASSKRRIAVYCRVSTRNEEQDMSFEAQCRYYRNRVESDQKLTLVDIYADHGISGLSIGKRAEFRRLMDDCLRGLVDEVWTKSISRFARNLADCVKSVRQLREKGIPVVFEKEGINSMDGNSELLLSVLAACAQEESNALSQNIRWANERRNAMGMPSTRVAYGYRRDRRSRTNQWVVHEEEARRIRLLFQMAAKGCAYSEIAEALTGMEKAAGEAARHGGPGEDGQSPPAPPKCGYWRRPRIAACIRNVVYIGDFVSNKSYTADCFDKKQKRNRGQRHQYYMEDHHAPLVDRETFALANCMQKVGALRSALSPVYRHKLVQYALCPEGERPMSDYMRRKKHSSTAPLEERTEQ